MNYLIEKLKSLSAGVLALSFLLAISLSACTPATKEAADEDADATEHVEGTAEETTDEHPSGGEHPTADEDTTATEDEHPQ